MRSIHGQLRWHVLLGFTAMGVALLISARVPGAPERMHMPGVWAAAGLAVAAGAVGTFRFWDRPGTAWLIGPALVPAVILGVAVWATGGADSHVLPVGLGLAAVAAALLPARWAFAVSVVCTILIAWPLWEGTTPEEVQEAILLLPTLAFVASMIHAVKRITITESSQRRYLTSLVRASTLSTQLDFNAALRSVAEGIQEELHADHAIVYLADEERRVLEPKVVLISPDVALPGEEEALRTYVGRMDQGLTGWTYRHAQPILSGDASADPRAVAIPGAPRRDLSYLVLPLIAAGKVLGVIRVSQIGLNRFDEDDLKLATVFANQAAVAIQNARLYEEARRLNITDPLTGLFNARHLQESLENELTRARRYQRPLSLAMLDSDQLKAVNDRFGHVEGDRYLVRIAETIRSHVRNTDRAYRYAGDEFVILLPETGAAEALPVIERIRKAIEECPLDVDRQQMSVTISAGVASFPEHRTAEELLRAADAAMYRAKRDGKNRVRSGAG